MGVSELFVLIADLAMARGAPVPLSSKPGVWSTELGDFVISLNGHPETLPDPLGLELEPYFASVHAPKFLCVPMLLCASGGIGHAGLEDDVISAIKAELAAIARATGGQS